MSCFMWSDALDSSGLLLPYPLILLSSSMTTTLISALKHPYLNFLTQNFNQNFSKYGSPRPSFATCPYPEAVQNAFHAGKFLLVYLHSPMHSETDNFCKNVLCKQDVVNFFGQSMVTWGGNIQDPEGYSLSMQFNACAFPFMALVVCRSERKIEIVTRIQVSRSFEGYGGRIVLYTVGVSFNTDWCIIQLSCPFVKPRKIA